LASDPGHPTAVVLFLLLAGAAACSTPPAALRADTLAYLQKMSAWAPVEGETARTLERIMATQFVNEAELRREIAESTPRVQRQLDAATAYEPRTAEVRRIHGEYTKAWRTLLDGYGAITTGLEHGEQHKLADGRQAMLRWRDTIIEVARELRALRDRVGVDMSEVTPS
jgi:hypothetical protein